MFSCVVRNDAKNRSSYVPAAVVQAASDCSALGLIQEVVPDWQSSAATVIVALGTVYGRIVLDELLSKFEAGKVCVSVGVKQIIFFVMNTSNMFGHQVPHYYVIKTLGDFAVTNVFVTVPALEDTLSKCLPMLGMIKMENMKVLSMIFRSPRACLLTPICILCSGHSRLPWLSFATRL